MFVYIAIMYIPMTWYPTIVLGQGNHFFGDMSSPHEYGIGSKQQTQHCVSLSV